MTKVRPELTPRIPDGPLYGRDGKAFFADPDLRVAAQVALTLGPCRSVTCAPTAGPATCSTPTTR